MSDPTLHALLKDYEQKKYKADLNFEKEKTAFYNSEPELLHLTEKLGQIAIEISKAILNGNIELEQKLRCDYNTMKQEKEKLLQTIDIPKRSFITNI